MLGFGAAYSREVWRYTYSTTVAEKSHSSDFELKNCGSMEWLLWDFYRKKAIVLWREYTTIRYVSNNIWFFIFKPSRYILVGHSPLKYAIMIFAYHILIKLLQKKQETSPLDTHVAMLLKFTTKERWFSHIGCKNLLVFKKMDIVLGEWF